jgi:hypothetical protein
MTRPSAQLTLPDLELAAAKVPTGLWVMLSHLEQSFVAALLADPKMEQKAAYLKAGGAVRGAKQGAHRMAQRPHVKAAIECAMAERAERAEVTVDRVLREVDTVSLSCVSHYRMTDDGHVEPTEDAPPDAMRAISSIKRRSRVLPNNRGVEYEVEFRLWDKPGTLRLSMQHRGMLIEKHEVTLPPGSGVLAVPLAPGDRQWAAGAAAQQADLASRPAMGES